jgi:hypothetical protein
MDNVDLHDAAISTYATGAVIFEERGKCAGPRGAKAALAQPMHKKNDSKQRVWHPAKCINMVYNFVYDAAV